MSTNQNKIKFIVIFMFLSFYTFSWIGKIENSTSVSYIFIEVNKIEDKD